MSEISNDAPSLRESLKLGPVCPSCDADLDGGEIADHLHQYYSPPYRWQRVIGISDGDSYYAWRCPDCAHEWVREGEERRASLRGWTPPAARKDGSSPNNN